MGYSFQLLVYALKKKDLKYIQTSGKMLSVLIGSITVLSLYFQREELRFVRGRRIIIFLDRRIDVPTHTLR